MNTIPAVTQLCAMTDNMYRLGWDERNGGNVSMLLDDGEVLPYIGCNQGGLVFPLTFDASPLAGRLMLVTATGSYFRKISEKPEDYLGVIRFSADGKSAETVWGFENGNRPTSELSSHCMTHIVRLRRDASHRVVMHAHPTNLVAMTFVHTLDEREFTRTLWRMCTECVIVFPDGVGVLPWMLCGNDAIGEATAAKMNDSRLTVWAQHGIFGTGAGLDDAFGLLETAEKAAELYMKICGRPILNVITDEQLALTARAFGVTVRKGWLDA